jgi:hypothetical protein
MFTPISYRDATENIARLHSQADHHRLLRRSEIGRWSRRRGRAR